MRPKAKQWIGVCIICGKAWADYASNRKDGTAETQAGLFETKEKA